MADIASLTLSLVALNVQIKKAATNHTKANCETKAGKKYYAARIDSLEKLWKSFTDLHVAIWSTKDGAQSEYAKGELYEETELIYINLLSTLLEELEESFPALPPNTNTNEPRIQSVRLSKPETRLPPIHIPTFDGNYKSWRTFHDLFNSLIHTDLNISKVQKLHYLKLSVTGEAERLLRQFEVTEANYVKAWELLQKRYNNKRAQVNTHLKTLLNQTPIRTESAHAIRSLLDQTEESLHELKYLELPIEHWDAILIHNLVQRLPSETHQLWEQDQGSKTDIPTYADLSTFLESRFRTLESLQVCQNLKPLDCGRQARSPNQQENRRGYKTTNDHPSSTKHTHKGAYAFMNKSYTCVKCKQNHTLFHCPAFKKLTPTSKLQFVQQFKLCKNCLASGHNINSCPSHKTCFLCHKQHNTLLHVNQSLETKNEITNIDQRQAEMKLNQPSGSNEPTSLFTTNVNRALLSTALVHIEGPNGQKHEMRALIDSGSQVSFITEAASRRVRLPKNPIKIKVTGLGKTQTASIKAQTSFKLRSLHTSFKINIEAFILKQITDFIPADTIDSSKLPYLQHLILADPKFYVPGPIDILLGADIYADIIENGIIKGAPGEPTAQHTQLGWILMGKTKKSDSVNNINTLTVQVTDNDKLSQQLRKFWELEEIPQKVIHPDDQLCEEKYKNSHRRLSHGVYLVKLPFKNENGPELGQTRPMAIKQFLQLEQRLKKHPEMCAEYKACIKEYQRLGHMKKIPPSQIKTEQSMARANQIQHYYLPHHAVTKESSTTKMRVVFNASARSSNGQSLNQQMLVGPTIQPTLWAIILQWRLYKYVLTADIEKMYRMIHMHPNHQEYQRIIWRDSPDEPLKDFRLTTVTFGTAAAPYLAIRTLHQLANDEEHNFPLAAKSIKTEFYVDDLLTGAHDINTGLSLQRELISTLSKGGFNLRKWTANSPELLANIPITDQEVKPILNLSEKNTIKTLGLQWNPMTDEFSFTIKPTVAQDSYTKRSILSETAALFDPLGWLAPCVILAKIFIQRLWLGGYAWDEPLPPILIQEWTKYQKQLQDVKFIKIPRWINYGPKIKNMQLHGFCDASTKAYASVAFIRIISENDTVTTQLLTSKTRVAPTKTTSLPKLELCGALILSRLLKQIQNDMKLQDIATIAWCDSEITLAWIQSHPTRWKTFVANRVAEIQENIQPQLWRFVPSKDNPADCATRGLYPTELSNYEFWWNGPSWLQQHADRWPQQHTTNKCFELESRKVKALTCTDNPNDWLNKYSSFPKLIRIIAYCRRFYFNCQTTTNHKCDDLRQAEAKIITLIQKQTFADEYESLVKQKPIPTKSRLLSLNPFLDTNQIIRVGGRLENAILTYDQKHPMILPNNHHVSKIIIDYIHLYTLHGGTQLVLNTLRNKYWLINARNTIRQRIYQCITCFRTKPKPSNQLMGNLPSPRTTPSMAFEHTGVDYAGPIDIKTSKIRNAKITKAYLSIFVCMATKAIHIEIVTELTTTTFLAALKRFTSRRGLCRHLYSDCGTNFIGANKELSCQLQKLSCQLPHDISKDITLTGITWHFNPPAAPHFGGLWEAGVKSIKTHATALSAPATTSHSAPRKRPALTASTSTTALYDVPLKKPALMTPPNKPALTASERRSNTIPTRPPMNFIVEPQLWEQVRTQPIPWLKVFTARKCFRITTEDGDTLRFLKLASGQIKVRLQEKTSNAGGCSVVEQVSKIKN